jgi:hypothetical protein
MFAVSPEAGGFDLSDVDFAHLHHCCEGARGLGAAGGHRLGERAGSDQPIDSPAILAPAALAFLSAVADYGVPIGSSGFLVAREQSI